MGLERRFVFAAESSTPCLELSRFMKHEETVYFFLRLRGRPGVWFRPGGSSGEPLVCPTDRRGVSGGRREGVVEVREALGEAEGDLARAPVADPLGEMGVRGVRGVRGYGGGDGPRDASGDARGVSLASMAVRHSSEVSVDHGVPTGAKELRGSG